MIDGVLTEYAMLDEQGLVRIPEYLSYEEAAALPLAAVTAWHALTAGAPLRPGQTVLTLSSGAVSVFTAQLAVVAGARVIATTSSAAKADRLRKLGVDEVIDYRRTSDWHEAVRELTGETKGSSIALGHCTNRSGRRRSAVKPQWLAIGCPATPVPNRSIRNC